MRGNHRKDVTRRGLVERCAPLALAMLAALLVGCGCTDEVTAPERVVVDPDEAEKVAAGEVATEADPELADELAFIDDITLDISEGELLKIGDRVLGRKTYLRYKNKRRRLDAIRAAKLKAEGHLKERTWEQAVRESQEMKEQAGGREPVLIVPKIDVTPAEVSKELPPEFEDVPLPPEHSLVASLDEGTLVKFETPVGVEQTMGQIAEQLRIEGWTIEATQVTEDPYKRSDNPNWKRSAHHFLAAARGDRVLGLSAVEFMGKTHIDITHLDLSDLKRGDRPAEAEEQ